MLRRLGRTLAIVLALGLGLPPCPALPDPEESWIRVRTENFTLISGAPEKLTVGIGLDLERLRETLRLLLRDLELSSAVPTYVFVFPNQRSFGAYVSVDNPVVGYFVGHPHGNYLAVDAGPEQDPSKILYHEYLHFVLNNNAAGHIPTWFDEGMAEFFSTLRVRDGKVEIGRRIPRHLRWLRTHRLMPLKQLFAIDTRSPGYHERSKSGGFYAASWALVHCLYTGPRREQVVRFLDRTRQGVAPEAAFREAFDGVTRSELQAELLEYVRAGQFRPTRHAIREPRVDTTVEIQPLPRPEALVHLGDYLAHFGPERYDDAEQYFRAALEIEPDQVGALVGLGFLSDERGRHREAERWYRGALERDRVPFIAHYLYGRNLVLQHDTGGERLVYPEAPLPPILARARSQFQAAASLNPAFAEAHAGVGYTYLFDPDDVAPGIEALELARALKPRAEQYAYHQMVLHLKRGERAQAAAIQRTVLSSARDDELRQLAREALLRDDVSRADRLFDDHRFDEGLALLEEVRAATDDRELRARVDQQMNEVRSFMMLREQVARYNRAVDLVRRGAYPEATHVLRDLLHETLSPDLERSVRDLLGELYTLKKGGLAGR